MEPINLTDVQGLYLQVIFDYFQTESRWPTHKYLERQFIQTHPDIYIDELVQSLPSGLTNAVSLSYLDSKAYLTVPGMYQCQGSMVYLDAFVNVIEICVNTYFKSPDELCFDLIKFVFRHRYHVAELASRPLKPGSTI